MRHRFLFFLVLAAFATAGCWLGITLSRHPKLEWFKLLNIVGLACDFLGILVLSEIAISSERVSQFFVNWLAGLLLWGQTVVPLGAATGSWLFGEGPSQSLVTQFFTSYFVYSLLPLAVLEGFVFGPEARARYGTTQRSRAFGLWLLIVGTLAQLVAAFKDLYT